MAGLKYWDGTQWVLLPGGAGDFVKRLGDIMSGPLTITDDGSENPNALLLYVAGEMVAGTAMASAVIADTVVTSGIEIVDGAQPGYVWTATDDSGHGEWQPLTNITPGPAAVIFSDTAPQNPLVGMQWWDTSKPDVAPFAVYVKSPTNTVTVGATSWTSSGWPSWTIDLPCDGLLKVTTSVLAKPGQGVTAACKAAVKSVAGCTVADLAATPTPSYDIGRVSSPAGTGTALVSDSSSVATAVFAVTGVPDDSTGTVELEWQVYSSGAAGCQYRLASALCEFVPYANERTIVLDMGAA